MGIVDNVLAGSSGSSGYLIQRSLRFRASASAYLNRTPAVAGNRKTWTWSGWVKLGALGGTNVFLQCTPNTSNQIHTLGINANNQVFYYFENTSGVLYKSYITSTAVCRDPSAWYHLVFVWDTTQATVANRSKVYINNQQVTLNIDNLGSSQFPQNYDCWINSTSAHNIGRHPSNLYMDGYLAEVNFIDGQALTPSSFGQTDAITGVWTPKKYTGTYGTNGFYLPFTDNTSATTLAYDFSGNGNNWTANNISTTAGVTYDSMTDVPTLTSTDAANYCTLNPLTSNVAGLAPQQGNLYFGNNATYNMSVNGTIGVSSGKWYWEVKPDSAYCMVGITALSYLPANIAPHQVGSQAKIYYSANGQKYDNGNNALYGATWTTTDVVGVALDLDAGTITFYKNNTSQGTAYTGLSGTYWPVFGGANGQNVGYINFGQRPFSYTPPTGFKALNTFNLPDPTIKKPNQYMDATTFTGTGGNTSVTNAGAFQPDLVWAKGRSTAQNNWLVDSVRGANNVLFSNLTNAEGVGTGVITAFNSNGFNIDASFTNAATYVGWQWKESATAGFDIVAYTGNGANRNISHSLGIAPSMIIVKQRSSTEPWVVYNSNFSSPTGDYLFLNTTAAKGNVAGYWYTGANSSTFGVGPYSTMNANAATYVAYLFSEIPGFSKFGSYTGNGSTDGPFVYCGFRPKYVLIKYSSGVDNWAIFDSSRLGYNADNNELQANTSNAEGTSDFIDIISNGFKNRNSDTRCNASGGTYIYAAFAENPFKFANAR